MVEVFGYGEDALTYWVLTRRLDDFLEQLKDRSKASECALFYRPSFGRGGRSLALLGEFDAILLSPVCMYLIESKWSHSPELRTGKLAECQKLRHRTVRWIAENWDGKQPFNDFCEQNRVHFKESFGGKELPPIDTGVFYRLNHVLTKAHVMSKGESTLQIRDIFLVILEKGCGTKMIESPDGFELKQMEYNPIDASNFFDMNG